MSRLSFRALSAVVALASFAACGGSIAKDNDTSTDAGPIAPGRGTFDDGGTRNPNPDAADAGSPGTLVFSDDTTVVLTIDGGFAAQGTDTSACIVEHEAYAYDFSNHALKWERCVIADGGARNELLGGSVVLSSSQQDALDAALARVAVIGIISTCASDLPEETLEISSPEQLTPEIYYDQFTRCGDRRITHVTGLDAVHDALASAVK